jgi:hypothetical protein
MLKTELRRTASCRIYQSLLFFSFFSTWGKEKTESVAKYFIKEFQAS